MRERDLQDYLYEHPEVLFPEKKVLEKHREYRVGGKRVDLFFRVDDGIGYIVEIKKVPLTREHLGQVVEYYGLLRGAISAANLRMVLVSPKIPDFRKIYLDELGIRCVELSVPDAAHVEEVKREMRAVERVETEKVKLETSAPPGLAFDFGMVTGEVTREGVALVLRATRDMLVPLRRTFAAYEIMPFRIDKAYTPDIECLPDVATNALRFDRGRLWWAFRIGDADEMPKNDIPNFSIIGAADGVELCTNAELRPAQDVVLRSLRAAPDAFDRLLTEHAGVELRLWLKLEHRPRFYHWVLVEIRPPGTFSARDVLATFDDYDARYPAVRESWIDRVQATSPFLSPGEREHMHDRNTKLNLAIRFMRRLTRTDPLWSMAFSQQVDRIHEELVRLKPFLEFFIDRASRRGR